MKPFYALILALMCTPAAAICDLSKGVNVKTGGDSTSIFVTYWCPPESKYLDYTADWGSLSLTASASVQQQVVAAIKSGSTDALRKLATSSTMPAAVKAQLLATQPPAPVVAAKNGSAVDRPTYAIIKATGLRSTAPYDMRATVGARAACQVLMVTEGSSVYCAWTTATGTTPANVVTLISVQ